MRTHSMSAILSQKPRRRSIWCQWQNRKQLSAKERKALVQGARALQSHISKYQVALQTFFPAARNTSGPSTELEDLDWDADEDSAESDTGDADEEEEEEGNATGKKQAAVIKGVCTIALGLPSQIPEIVRRGLAAAVKAEVSLRIAQVDESLTQIRHLLRIRQHMSNYKQEQARGQVKNTRARTLLNRCQLKLLLAVAGYHGARQALIELQPHDLWDTKLKHLSKEELRAPGERRSKFARREGRRKLGEIKKKETIISQKRQGVPWIWRLGAGASAQHENKEDSEGKSTFFLSMCSGSDVVLSTDLRVEWADSYSRWRRWEEEILLVQEEMRRILAFQVSKANWWRERACQRADAADDVCAGISAYAEKQAHLCLRFGRHCAKMWTPVLQKNSFKTTSWPVYYSEKHEPGWWESDAVISPTDTKGMTGRCSGDMDEGDGSSSGDSDGSDTCEEGGYSSVEEGSGREE